MAAVSWVGRGLKVLSAMISDLGLTSLISGQKSAYDTMVDALYLTVNSGPLSSRTTVKGCGWPDDAESATMLNSYALAR